jgi:hypothetical protein
MTEDQRIRLNLAVTLGVKERIERLQEASDGASMTEVIRRALATYETLLEVQAEGGQLVIETPSGERERLRLF